MMVSRAAVAGGLVAAVLAFGAVLAQQPPYVPKQADRPSPIEGDEPGFTPIFDGRSLKDWEGDPAYWRVEGGAIVGEITPATIVKSNTFVIWRGGRPKDFELKLDYRITPVGNSGINYRSASVPDPITPENRFAMRGYQFDIDGPKRYIGQNYEEKGRLFMAMRGQITRVVGGRPPIVVASIGDEAQLAGVDVPPAADPRRGGDAQLAGAGADLADGGAVMERQRLEDAGRRERVAPLRARAGRNQQRADQRG